MEHWLDVSQAFNSQSVLFLGILFCILLVSSKHLCVGCWCMFSLWFLSDVNEYKPMWYLSLLVEINIVLFYQSTGLLFNYLMQHCGVRSGIKCWHPDKFHANCDIARSSQYGRVNASYVENVGKVKNSMCKSQSKIRNFLLKVRNCPENWKDKELSKKLPKHSKELSGKFERWEIQIEESRNKLWKEVLPAGTTDRKYVLPMGTEAWRTQEKTTCSGVATTGLGAEKFADARKSTYWQLHHVVESSSHKAGSLRQNNIMDRLQGTVWSYIKEEKKNTMLSLLCTFY